MRRSERVYHDLTESKEFVEMLETRKIDLIVDTLPISTTKSSVKKVTLSRLQNCFARGASKKRRSYNKI